jgi:biopolymer transport protein ExbD
MAELNNISGKAGLKNKRRGGVRAKRMSTQIDMTPMVDLGFLLVTFFILTTSMQQPKAMEMIMPEDGPEGIYRQSETMVIIPSGMDKIFYYFPTGELKETRFQAADINTIGKVIIDRNKMVYDLQHQNNWKEKGVSILIKPSKDSRYQNLVDILDEMKIDGIKTYALMDITAEEAAMLPE